MSPRLFCNVTFAWLMKDLDSEGRKALERELYAPADGWDAANQRVLAAMTEGNG